MKFSIRFLVPIIMAQCVRSFHIQASRTRSIFTLNSVGTVSRSRYAWRLLSTVSADNNGEKKRVVFLGTPEVAASSLRRLYEDSMKQDSAYEIVGVVTQPPKRRKRNGKPEPSPVGKVAEEIGLPVLCPEKVRSFPTTYYVWRVFSFASV
jgi:FlaA1/EpsC-like NDP-sugar epimerase